MAKRSIDDTTLKNIADAIREKAGTSDAMTPAQMAQAIAAIVTGGGTSCVTGRFTVAENKKTVTIAHGLGKVPVGAICCDIGDGSSEAYNTYMFVMCANFDSKNFYVITTNSTSQRNYFYYPDRPITGPEATGGAFGATSETIIFGGTQKYGGVDVNFVPVSASL